MKLNWASEQVKAAKNYLATITSNKKNVRQISSVRESVRGQQIWLQQLTDAYAAVTKCTASLQADKWEAKRQLTDSGNIIRALIQVRQTFVSLVVKKQPGLIEETSFDESNQPNRLLGENHASWMQRLAKDAISSIRCVNAFFVGTFPLFVAFASYITLVAQHVLDKDAKKFGSFFKKLGISNESNDDLRAAWSVILPHTIKEAMDDIKTLTNVWFSTQAQSWTKTVDAESRKASLKDAEGNLIYCITAAKSPLKEFCETSYQYRGADFEI